MKAQNRQQKSFNSQVAQYFLIGNGALAALCLVLVKLAILLKAYKGVMAQGRDPVLCSWDCGYYIQIAVGGYFKSGGQGPLAFFPVFPLSVRWIKTILPQFSFSQIAIGLNLICYFFVIWALLKWTKDKALLRHWYVPAILWTFDRFTFWAMVPYTESLFCLVLLIFLLGERKTESGRRFFYLGFLAGFSTGIRLVGAAIGLSLMLSRFRALIKRPIFSFFLGIISLWGVLAFFAWNHFEYGTWTQSLKTTASWERKFSFLGFFNSLYFLVKSFYLPTVPLLFLTTYWLFKGPKAFTLRERICFGFLIFIPMASTIPISLTRYLSILFPGYIALCFYLEKYSKPWLWWSTTLFFLIEIYWQETLLEKFLRVEVFNWAG